MQGTLLGIIALFLTLQSSVYGSSNPDISKCGPDMAWIVIQGHEWLGQVDGVGDMYKYFENKTSLWKRKITIGVEKYRPDTKDFGNVLEVIEEVTPDRKTRVFHSSNDGEIYEGYYYGNIRFLTRYNRTQPSYQIGYAVDFSEASFEEIAQFLKKEMTRSPVKFLDEAELEKKPTSPTVKRIREILLYRGQYLDGDAAEVTFKTFVKANAANGNLAKAVKVKAESNTSILTYGNIVLKETVTETGKKYFIDLHNVRDLNFGIQFVNLLLTTSGNPKISELNTEEEIKAASMMADEIKVAARRMTYALNIIADNSASSLMRAQQTSKEREAHLKSIAPEVSADPLYITTYTSALSENSKKRAQLKKAQEEEVQAAREKRTQKTIELAELKAKNKDTQIKQIEKLNKTLVGGVPAFVHPSQSGLAESQERAENQAAANETTVAEFHTVEQPPPTNAFIKFMEGLKTTMGGYRIPPLPTDQKGDSPKLRETK